MDTDGVGSAWPGPPECGASADGVQTACVLPGSRQVLVPAVAGLRASEGEGPELIPKLIKDALLQLSVHAAVPHGPLGELKIGAARPHVLDKRHVAVGAIADEFGDQPQLKDNRRNGVPAEV